MIAGLTVFAGVSGAMFTVVGYNLSLRIGKTLKDVELNSPKQNKLSTDKPVTLAMSNLAGVAVMSAFFLFYVYATDRVEVDPMPTSALNLIIHAMKQVGFAVFAVHLNESILFPYHVICHKIPFLNKMLHATHHEYRFPNNWFAGLYLSSTESLITTSIGLWILCCFKWYLSAFSLYAMMIGITPAINHSGFEVVLPFGIYDSRFHLIHHRYPNKNYGEYCPLFDMLYGSYMSPELYSKHDEEGEEK